MCNGIRTILHMLAYIQVLLSTFFISYLPSSSSVAPGLATNTGSEGQQPSSCHSVVCFVLVSSLISYKGGRLKWSVSKYDVVDQHGKRYTHFISRRKTYRSIEQIVTTRDPIDKTILSPIVCSVVDLRNFHSCKREHTWKIIVTDLHYPLS